MALPYLQSYNDPKIDKAYRRYISGHSQRKIAAALKVPARTLARYCKNDGWEAERKSRAIAADASSAPNVAATAAEVAAPVTSEGQAAATSESGSIRMERMLEEQQYLAGILKTALRKDIEATVAAAETSGTRLSRSQVAQLANLTNNILALERKAWCVPDKIERKDTTPPPEDRVRKLADGDLDRELAEAERAEAAAAARETAPPSVN